MKKYFLPVSFAAALIGVSTACAEENKGGITREQAEGIAVMVTRPVTEVIVPAVNNAMAEAAAASWALWDLINGLSEQQKAGKKPEPDLALVGTYIRLTMRCAPADLCLRQGAACKEYPGDADFLKAARMAEKNIKEYAAGQKNQSLLKPLHRGRITGFMDTARKRVIFSLPLTKSTIARPTPPSPEEDKYLKLALEKKKGPKYAFPPWP